MRRRVDVKDSWAHREFTVAEARCAGLTRRELQSGAYRRVAQGIYRLASLPETPEMILRCLHRSLPRDAVFSGATAAWLHGLATEPCRPAEVTVAEASWLRPRGKLAVVRTELERTEIVIRRELPATNALRTLTDLGRRAPLFDAVVALDEALHRRLVDQTDLHRFAAGHHGAKGVARLRRALDLVEPSAESPMETRLRLVLVLAGLPVPEVQPTVTHEGRFVARPDLLYRAQRLVLEYDGGTHRDSLAEDNRRQNRLISAGYRVLRFTASDVQRHPDSVVAQVRTELFR